MGVRRSEIVHRIEFKRHRIENDSLNTLSGILSQLDPKPKLKLAIVLTKGF